VIKSYFLNYASLSSDFTVELMTNKTTVHSIDHDQDWQVTLAYTGELTMTGARVARAAAKYLGDAKSFAVTYGDGLTDANLADEYEFHAREGRLGTVLGVNPPSRFGELIVDGSKVQAFKEKPDFHEQWINGGYFFFERDFISHLDTEESCVLEKQPLVRLADRGELSIYRHRGFWGCMDTQRDKEYLEKLWASGDPPWAPV